MSKHYCIAVCLMDPTSGFDVAETNQMINDFRKKEIETLSVENMGKAEIEFNRIVKEQNGRVIKHFLFEVIKSTTDFFYNIKEELSKKFENFKILEIIYIQE